jgi:hypothetical protein
MRAREEGRPGPFSHVDQADEPRRPVPGGVEARRAGSREAADDLEPEDGIEE